jgi:hypothetical protein
MHHSEVLRRSAFSRQSCLQHTQLANLSSMTFFQVLTRLSFLRSKSSRGVKPLLELLSLNSLRS